MGVRWLKPGSAWQNRTFAGPTGKKCAEGPFVSSNMSKVYFVGAGPGDPELITVKGLRIIREADLVLFAGSLVPQGIAAQAKKGAHVVDSSPLTLEQTHALLVETVTGGGMAARVHTGDPSLFGALREQMRLLDKEGIPYEVIPGVSAALAAAAAAKVSFTVPEKTQTLILTRPPGRTTVPDAESLRELAGHKCAMAIYLSGHDPKTTALELISGGLPETTPVVVAHKIGQPGESIIATTLHAMGRESRTEDMARQTVFLVLPGEDGEDHPSKLYDINFKHGFRP